MGCSGSKDTSSGAAAGSPPTSGGNPTAPEPQKDPVGNGNGDGNGDEAPTVLKLSAAQLKRIQDLFDMFDLDTLGKLPLVNFFSASLKVGPHESGVLEKLKEMDYDSDGFITRDEWEKYFTAMTVLTDDEFTEIYDELSATADICVNIIRCTRLAAEAGPAPPADDMEVVAPLSDARVAKVNELFAAWDVAGTGSIDRRKLKDGGLMMGPHKVNLLSQLDEMDTDKDNLVTKDEMLAFFQAASTLSDENFDIIYGDMMAVAQDAATIAMLTAMANDFAGGAPPAEDLDDVQPLSAPRLEQLKELWALLSSSTDTPVALDDMKKAEKGSMIGPHSVSVLKEMYAMDTNSDGKLQWAELLDYFTKAGTMLSEDEFTEIVGDMTTRIQMQLLAQMVMG